MRSMSAVVSLAVPWLKASDQSYTSAQVPSPLYTVRSCTGRGAAVVVVVGATVVVVGGSVVVVVSLVGGVVPGANVGSSVVVGSAPAACGRGKDPLVARTATIPASARTHAVARPATTRRRICPAGYPCPVRPFRHPRCSR